MYGLHVLHLNFPKDFSRKFTNIKNSHGKAKAKDCQDVLRDGDEEGERKQMKTCLLRFITELNGDWQIGNETEKRAQKQTYNIFRNDVTAQYCRQLGKE